MKRKRNKKFQKMLILFFNKNIWSFGTKSSNFGVKVAREEQKVPKFWNKKFHEI